MSAEPQFPGQEPAPKGRHLSVVRTSSSMKGETRSPRALVPEATPRNNRRLLYLVFSLIPLMLLVVLLLNILTATRQYDLVDLKAQEQNLSQQNEALSQEIEYHQAPQDLAIRASQLGLVSTSVQATINLQTGEVSGTPMAATSNDDAAKNLIDPPSLNDTDASAVASERAAEQKKKDEEKAKKEKEAEAKASASASAEASPENSPSQESSTSPTPSPNN